MKPGEVSYMSCWTEYCSATKGICGFCGWEWSECDCHSSDGTCACGREQEGFCWWNVFTIALYTIKGQWWNIKGWIYGESPLSDWLWKRAIARDEEEQP